MGALLKGAKKASLSDVVQVIADAATRDVNAVYLGNRMTKWALDAKLSKDARKAAKIVKSWVSDGAHRENADRDETMDRGNALAIFDAWWDQLVHRVFDDELGPEFFERGRVSVTSYSPTTGSSFGFGFKDYLERAFHRPTSKKLACDYCDKRGTKKKEACRAQVVGALKAAVKQLIADQGANLAAWSTPAENIVFSNQGAGSVSPIPWQNRGTHNHAVEVLGSS